MHSERGAEICQLIDEATQQFVDALGLCARERLDIEELTTVLQAAFRGRNRMESAITGAIGALDRLTHPDPDSELTGGLHPAVWLADALHIGTSAAHAQLALARQLEAGHLAGTAEAFQRGEISSQHASVVVRSVEMAVRGGCEPRRAEELMLQQAAQSDPRSLFRYGLSLVRRLAPEEVEAEERRQEERRYLHLEESFFGGCDLEGHLTPLQFTALKKAMNGVLGTRRQDGDERTAGQRRADALVELARRALDSGELPERGGQRPHISVLADLATLRKDPGAPAALLDWGFPISATRLREIAGDADLIPILTTSDGDPLHVGRRCRTATRKMRRALEARDGRCVWPRCRDHPDWTQGDHVIPWADGGPTEVESMRLLCQTHHARRTQGWRLEKGPDGKLVAIPPPPGGPVYGPAIYEPPPGRGP